MIIIPSHSVIQNVILMSACLTPKMSKDGGSECGSIVGVNAIFPSKIAWVRVPSPVLMSRRDSLDVFVWEFVRHLSCPPPTVICRIKSEIPRNGIIRD